jgi:cardiolipin synthase (CMP-forming)
LLNLPNILTLSRIAIIPIVLTTFFFDSTAMRWAAVSLFTLAGITDFFDGYLARRANQVSRLGRFLDPIADKLLVASVLLVLVGFNRVEEWTYIPAIVIMLREILVSGLREFLAELHVGLPVTKLAKGKTTVQMVALGFLIVGTAVPMAKPAGEFLLWLAALLTIITGYDYLKAGLKHMGEPTQKQSPDARRDGPDS